MNRGFDAEVLVIGADCCTFFSSSKTLADLFSANEVVDLFLVVFLVVFFTAASDLTADFSDVTFFFSSWTFR